ncbi:leukocyte immunoglobulin-like receptor subfamily A member 6 [Mus caroli]|uniref:Leukocyte immunoglobulin-like receptor subfamily A member 6 n=1 Tax=Mus caroli TaxID=10089 RepID=A0A6P5PTC5_MUSCR|nr:leukocyte immunoglobulin-like receptor subfamily A member 6 [Mus caroli]
MRSRIPVLAGALPKPTIKADPDTPVSRGTQVSISCKGISDAWKYLLYIQKFEHTQPKHTQTSTNRGRKAVFHIGSVGKHDGGQYFCLYETTAGWSVRSDKLELIVTGFFDNKPSLTALPRPMVTSGESVTLKCFSQEEYDRFIVIKEGEQKYSMIMQSQKTYFGQFQTLFSEGTVTPNSSGTFKCYGYYKANPQVWSEPSDHLEIYVSANHTLAPLKTLITRCTDSNYDRFVLSKEGRTYLSSTMGYTARMGFPRLTTLSPVISSHGYQLQKQGITWNHQSITEHV